MYVTFDLISYSNIECIKKLIGETLRRSRTRDAMVAEAFPCECRLRHRLKFEFHAKQPNGSEFSVEMTLGHLDQGSHHTGPHSSHQLVLAD